MESRHIPCRHGVHSQAYRNGRRAEGAARATAVWLWGRARGYRPATVPHPRARKAVVVRTGSLHERVNDQQLENDQLTETLQRTVDEGVFRLTRSWPALLATGLVGGADVTMGVFALFIVKTETHSEIAAAVAFSIGFIALTLANSELFTENYLVPVAAVLARKASTRSVGRLWVGTLVMNLAGGWLIMGLVTSGFPRLREAALDAAVHYDTIGIGWRSLAGAIIGGAAITLMTW